MRILHTENEIFIQADIAEIYQLAASVELWPEILPHYRWVHVLRNDGDRRLVEMAARRDRIPVRWRAEQRLFPEEPRITFRHVAGLTKGMEVKWVFGPTEQSGVRVAILHDLPRLLGLPLVGDLMANRIVGPLFIKDIAGKTLRKIKELAEAEVPIGDQRLQ
jgi:ribosome-associated toxin RatA of RatAB toxin-antitoxin module